MPNLTSMLCLLLMLTNSIGRAQNTRVRMARNSNPPKTTTAATQRDHDAMPHDLKLVDALQSLESNLMGRLTKIDAKIDAIESRLVDLTDKIGRQRAVDDQRDPIHVNVDAIVEAMNVELITSLNEIYLSVDDVDKKVQHNKNMLAQNYGALMTIVEHLSAQNRPGGNFSTLQQQQQQQRKERGLEQTRLISDILSMVRNRLHHDNNDNSTGAAALPVSVKPNEANRHNGSSTLRADADDIDDDAKFTDLASKKGKGGIIFPSVKNKPSKANTTFATDSVAGCQDVKGFSCSELLSAGLRQSGVYYLQIRGTTYWFMKVFCEQEIGDGGWTVIQRRDDFGEPRENFNRDWADYKNGFGDPAKEFWMGNENIFMLTNNEDYALRIELEDFEGNKRYAQYAHFKIHSEADYYKLEIDGYEGNAGDSLNDPWYGSNNSPFSTYNRDNDRSSLNCASMLKGGWWWKSCGRGLNGPSPSADSLAKGGIIWFQWNGHDYALKRSYMMMKPISKMT